MGVLSARQTRATVPLSNLPERTEWVDNSVLDVGTASTGLSNPPTGATNLDGMCYKDSNGVYWLRFNGEITGMTSAASTRWKFTGVNVDPGAYQGCVVAWQAGSLTTLYAVRENGADNFIAEFSGTITGSLLIFGDVPLLGKPTWFDANREAGFSIAAQVEPFNGASDGLMTSPTGLSDIAATMYGLKAYHHGTTYNGGNSPTITLSGGGGSLSSVEQCDIFPFQDQQGNWFANLFCKRTECT